MVKILRLHSIVISSCAHFFAEIPGGRSTREGRPVRCRRGLGAIRGKIHTRVYKNIPGIHIYIRRRVEKYILVYNYIYRRNMEKGNRNESKRTDQNGERNEASWTEQQQQKQQQRNEQRNERIKRIRKTKIYTQQEIKSKIRENTRKK